MTVCFHGNDLDTALGTDWGLVVVYGRKGGVLGATPFSVFCTGNLHKILIKKREAYSFLTSQKTIALIKENTGCKEEH